MQINKEFPIGFWNYTSLERTELEDVNTWDECGMSLALSPVYDPKTADKEKMLALLDKCAEKNIKVLVCDKRSHWTGAASNPEGYRKSFREAYADFGNHPTVIGFFVGDEPHKADNPDVYAAYKIQLEEAPELLPFLNLFPYYHVPDEFGHTDYAFGYKDFMEWEADFIPQCPLKVLSYDRYSQMNEDEKGVEEYFEDLRNHYQLAYRLKIPMWTTLLCVGHFRYRIPSIDDLRWQFNTAVASGCKGIMWFMFYLRGPIVNYRMAPINMFGEKTQTYYALADVLKTFHATYGSLFQKMDLEECYHIGKAMGGYPEFKAGDSEFIINASPVHNINGILSFFRANDGSMYLALVNNSNKESGQIALNLSKKIKHLYRIGLSCNETDVLVNHHDEGFIETENETVYSPWLAPGQMNLYKIII